jgi:hypothetical protein
VLAVGLGHGRHLGGHLVVRHHLANERRSVWLACAAAVDVVGVAVATPAPAEATVPSPIAAAVAARRFKR